MRQSRAVDLTREGKDLYKVVSSSLTEMGQTVKKLRELNDTQHISIGSTTAVLSMWLSQKIAQFWREYGHIQINQEVRDRPFRRPLSLDMIVEYSTNLQMKRPMFYLKIHCYLYAVLHLKKKVYLH